MYRLKSHKTCDVNPFNIADKNIFAKSVDPNEMAHYEQFLHDLHCLPFCFEFWLRPLFGTMV